MLSLETSHINGRAALRPKSIRRMDRRALSGALLAMAALSASATSDCWAQAVRLIKVDVMSVGHGFQASKLISTRVQNDKDEKIGTLDDLVITRDRAIYAIVQVGGFLGAGGHMIAVPYDSLNITDDGRKITLAGASKEALKELPEFEFKK